MKKKTLCVLLVVVFLMLVGLSLFLFPLLTQSTVANPVVHTFHSHFQRIEIDLEETSLTVCADTSTYIEIIGYRESEYYISETDGKLLLTDRFEKSNMPFKLSGLGKYIKESRHISDQKSIILHLSEEDSQTPVNMVIKNSKFTLSAPLSYLTLHAEDSTITADNMRFDRFNGKLMNCDSLFSIPYQATEFSRSIETHNTTLSLNGDERANTEQFVSNFQKPSFTVEAFGGTCRLVYPKDTP